VSELLRRPALELAELVRTGELGAIELVTAALERIDALEPRINAFTHVAHERALAAAAEIGPGDPRPFAGVPIAIKDNRPVAGMPLTFGSDLFGDYMPTEESYVVRRFRDAGFVIVGKTALPEAAILPTCESRRNGPTANPWDLSRTPGGSSGGSGAAVAAGMLPLAHANDGGGSTRIPAACCGLVGLKGARGRTSAGPSAGHSFLAGDGVLTRTVADTAALLDVLAGYELGDATWAPPPAMSYLESASAAGEAAGLVAGGLRVALVLNPPLDDAKVDPACEQAARDAAELLSSLGHRVEEFIAPWSGVDLDGDFTVAFGPGSAQLVLAGARLAGRPPAQEDVEPLTWALYERALTQGTIEYLSAQDRLQAFARRIVVAFSPYDIVLTPALGQRPLPTGTVNGLGADPWDHFHRSGLFTPFTAVINVTGQPAISLPLYQGQDGLPLAVQLIARPVREDVLLALAAQLEAALPWADRHPELA
jgi:amidase